MLESHLNTVHSIFMVFFMHSSCKGAHVMHAVREIKVQICDQYQKSPAKTWKVYIANAYSHGIVIPLPGF